jgi:hypothetical protein
MLETIGTTNVLWVTAEGTPLGSDASASDLIGEAYGQGADLLALPVERFDPEAWRLATRLLGNFVQKLQNYGYRLAFVGDVSGPSAASTAFTDFVRETNRRGHHLFVADAAELRARLG